MKRLATLIALGTWLLAGPASTLAGPSQGDVLTPPPRPVPFTAAQARSLEQLSLQPQHVVVATARAAYSPEIDRTMTEVGVRAVQIGIPGGILALLIAAAPL